MQTHKLKPYKKLKKLVLFAREHYRLGQKIEIYDLVLKKQEQEHREVKKTETRLAK